MTKTSVTYVAKEHTRNGGSGLCWKLTVTVAGLVVDTVYCGSPERAHQLAKGVRV